jgi:chemotaxis protein methyltransferase CheR
MLAKMGRYNDLAMSRGMTDSHKTRYFTEQGRVCVVNDNVRKNIEFQQLNLQDPFDHLGAFEIVFLRNVAIYFSMDFKRNLFARIARVLKPGGFLILGSAETLTGVSDDYELKQHGRGILYRVRNKTGRA